MLKELILIINQILAQNLKDCIKICIDNLIYTS